MSIQHREDLIAIRGLRCLIVDDNQRFLAVARDLLTNGGVAVAGMATNQAEALQQAARLRPDIVLVDLSLGGESGFELAHRLAERFPKLHVVLISTHDEDDFADLIADSPAVGFIPKYRLSAHAICKLLEADLAEPYRLGSVDAS